MTCAYLWDTHFEDFKDYGINACSPIIWISKLISDILDTFLGVLAEMRRGIGLYTLRTPVRQSICNRINFDQTGLSYLQV